jgi:glycosyltransferase involved in cell wall biosynthesis
VRHGESGYLLCSEDEMVEAIYRIENLDRRRCREWVRENFSIEKMVDSYEMLYRRIASGARA